MENTIAEIAEIREVVASLLDELQLEAYLFEIEPAKGRWQLTVECAIDEGWETIYLEVTKDDFKRFSDDVVFHQLLIDQWRKALSACKVKTH